MTEKKNKDFMRLLDCSLRSSTRFHSGLPDGIAFGSRIKSENDRKEEQGRSMVEMLGVLAVVGVLSVGGIAGYTYAMNKHYANELLNGASQRAVLVAAQISAGREPSLKEFDKIETAGGKFDGTIKKWDGEFGIQVTKVKESVCKNLIKATEDTDIILAKTDDSDLTESDCSGDENTFLFVYSNDLGKGGSNSGGNTDSNKGNAGATEDEDGAVCSGTRPGACSVCRKTYIDATAGHWYDSDALCTTDGQTCVDGTCVTSAADEPTFSGNMCKCLEKWGDTYCGANPEATNYASCNNDDANCVQYGTWDSTQEKCVIETFCTNNSDCTSDEYCHYTSVDYDTCKPNKKGTCLAKADAKGDFAEGTTAEAAGFIRSAGTMDWFSAQNFCRSYNKNLVTLEQMGLGSAVPSGKTYCYDYSGDGACQNIDATGWSAIQAKFGDDFYPWTANLVPSSSCSAFRVYLNCSPADVGSSGRDGNFFYALCK